MESGFSDRHNLVDINKTIQIEEFDKETRNAIFNEIASIFDKIDESTKNQTFIRILYTQAFNKKVSEIPTYYITALHDVEQVIDNNSYHEILTLIEFLVLFTNDLLHGFNYEHEFNQIFENNCVGYSL